MPRNFTVIPPIATPLNSDFFGFFGFEVKIPQNSDPLPTATFWGFWGVEAKSLLGGGVYGKR